MATTAAPWEIAEHAVPYPEIDGSRDQILLFIGRKGTGKSVTGDEIMKQWPPDADRLVMDINGDMDLSALDPVNLPSDPPYELPPRRRRELPEYFVWRPDPSRGSFREDVDRVLGLALYPRERRVLVKADEAGVIFEVHQVGPHGTTMIHQNRHHKVPLIGCMPRSKTVAPLLLSQADRIRMWDIPNPEDVKRIGDYAGIPPAVLVRELAETRRRGPHWSLEFIADPDLRGLYRLPPLPLS